MNCERCASPLHDSAHYCSSCGSSVAPTADGNDARRVVELSDGRSRSRRVGALAVLGVVAVIGGVLVMSQQNGTEQATPTTLPRLPTIPTSAPGPATATVLTSTPTPATTTPGLPSTLFGPVPVLGEETGIVVTIRHDDDLADVDLDTGAVRIIAQGVEDAVTQLLQLDGGFVLETVNGETVVVRDGGVAHPVRALSEAEGLYPSRDPTRFWASRWNAELGRSDLVEYDLDGNVRSDPISWPFGTSPVGSDAGAMLLTGGGNLYRWEPSSGTVEHLGPDDGSTPWSDTPARCDDRLECVVLVRDRQRQEVGTLPVPPATDFIIPSPDGTKAFVGSRFRATSGVIVDVRTHAALLGTSLAIEENADVGRRGTDSPHWSPDSRWFIGRQGDGLTALDTGPKGQSHRLGDLPLDQLVAVRQR